MFAWERCTSVLALVIGWEMATVSGEKPYRLEVEAFNVIRDPSYTLRINMLRVSKYNSTINVINGNFTYIEDLPVDTTVSLKAYQLMASNKYSMIPVGLKPFRYCDMMDYDKEFYPAFLAKSNFPRKCPVRKGNHWLKNFTFDFKTLPVELPGERWRMDCVFSSKTRTVTKFEAFFYINRYVKS